MCVLKLQWMHGRPAAGSVGCHGDLPRLKVMPKDGRLTH